MKSFVADSDDDGGDLESDSSPTPPSPQPGHSIESRETSIHAINLVALPDPVELTKQFNQPSLDDEDELSGMPPRKRCRTTDGTSTQTYTPNSKLLQRSKTLKTCSKSSQRQKTTWEDSEMILDERIPNSRKESLSPALSRSNVSQTHTKTPARNAWQLPNSLQEDFGYHDPNSMFPDVSSTVPDNTLTQKQLVEDAIDSLRAPQNFVEISVTDPTTQKTSDSSIPWSDYLHSPSVRSNSKGKSMQAIETSPLINRVESRPTCASQIDAAVAPQNSRGTTTNVTSKEDSTRNTGETTQALGDSQCQDTQVRVPLSSSHIDEQTNDEREGSIKPGKRKAGAKSRSDPLALDELPLDLPKELYKPRPSRSRSARLPEEPTALSQSHVQSSRSKAKRRKTTTESTGTVQHTSSEKLELICNMGFSPTQARNALETYNGDMDIAIERLLNPPRNLDQKHKKANPQIDHDVTVLVDSLERRVDSQGIQTTVDDKTTLGAQIKPQTEPKIRKNTSKSAKMIADSDEEEVDEDATVTETRPEKQLEEDKPLEETGGNEEQRAQEDHESSAMPQHESPLSKAKRSKSAPTISIGTAEDGPKPKKGRGRPRKEGNVAVEIIKDKEISTTKEPKARGRPRKVKEAALQQEDEQAEHGTGKSAAQTSNVLQTGDGITPSLQETVTMDNGAMENTGKSSAFQKLSPPCTPPKQSVGASDSSKNENSSPAKATKMVNEHSPLAKGRVPYRVGLSRRVRIAPLLRVVKK